jgi:exodeoxyribonuclease VII small subunit
MIMDGNSHKSNANLADLSFEQALNRLEETVSTLEAGGLTLAEATRLFEDGMKMARLCSEMLAAAELRISRIQTSYGEQMRMLADNGVEEEEV